MRVLNETMDAISPLYTDVMIEVQKHLDSLLKPKGSLGVLESNAVRLAGISGKKTTPLEKRVILVMCGDHGVAAQGVSSFPQEVSTLIAETMLSGLAGVAVLARHAGASLMVVDVGLKGDVKGEGIIHRKIARGTEDLSLTPAMSREQAVAAVEVGIASANAAIDGGAQILGTGEVGIGNTTASSALLCALTGGSPEDLVGRGAGLTDLALENKRAVVEKALRLHSPSASDPLGALAAVGGYDLAGLVGVYLAGAARRVPVVIDGFIAGVAAVTAVTLHPGVRDFLFASHASEEPGAKEVARQLDLPPMLTMGMRLGEGTGAALAFHLLSASGAVMSEMGSFSDIGM